MPAHAATGDKIHTHTTTPHPPGMLLPNTLAVPPWPHYLHPVPLFRWRLPRWEHLPCAPRTLPFGIVHFGNNKEEVNHLWHWAPSGATGAALTRTCPTHALLHAGRDGDNTARAPHAPAPHKKKKWEGGGREGRKNDQPMVGRPPLPATFAFLHFYRRHLTTQIFAVAYTVFYLHPALGHRAYWCLARAFTALLAAATCGLRWTCLCPVVTFVNASSCCGLKNAPRLRHTHRYHHTYLPLPLAAHATC